MNEAELKESAVFLYSSVLMEAIERITPDVDDLTRLTAMKTTLELDRSDVAACHTKVIRVVFQLAECVTRHVSVKFSSTLFYAVEVSISH